MVPYAEPRSNVYCTPPDVVEKIQLHYVVVRLSERRYAVAQYEGKSGGTLSFETVAVFNNYCDASDQALRLTAKRL